MEIKSFGLFQTKTASTPRSAASLIVVVWETMVIFSFANFFFSSGFSVFPGLFVHNIMFLLCGNVVPQVTRSCFPCLQPVWKYLNQINLSMFGETNIREERLGTGYFHRRKIDAEMPNLQTGKIYQ